MYIWLEALVIPQASRLAEEDKQKKTHTHTGLYPQAMIHRDTGEWVSSSEGPLTLSPSPCHLSPCPGPFFHHPFPGWPPPWILSLQPILTGQFCGSLQKSESDFFPVMCLYVIYWLHKGTELLYYNYTTDYINVCLCSAIVFTFIHSSRITMTNAIIASFETHYSWSTIKR